MKQLRLPAQTILCQAAAACYTTAKHVASSQSKTCELQELHGACSSAQLVYLRILNTLQLPWLELRQLPFQIPELHLYVSSLLPIEGQHLLQLAIQGACEILTDADVNTAVAACEVLARSKAITMPGLSMVHTALMLTRLVALACQG